MNLYWAAYALLAAAFVTEVVGWALGRYHRYSKPLLIFGASLTSFSASLFFLAGSWLFGVVVSAITFLSILTVVLRVLNERMDERAYRELVERGRSN